MKKLSDEEIENLIYRAASQLCTRNFPTDPNDLSGLDLIADLGCDSLDFINLLFQIEQGTGVRVPEKEISDLGLTVFGSLVSYVKLGVSEKDLPSAGGSF